MDNFKVNKFKNQGEVQEKGRSFRNGVDHSETWWVIHSGVVRGQGAAAPGAGGQMGSGCKNSALHHCLPRAANFLATSIVIQEQGGSGKRWIT